jgi:asparaginyl-tRNA synthetase
LTSEQEKFLCRYFNSPIFVTDYPKEIKAFYMKDNSDEKTVACFDLLFPEIGEIIGGSLREDDYDNLKRKSEKIGINSENLA